VSFGILPRGYAPDEVDSLLGLIASKLEAGEDPSDIIEAAAFSSAPVGYAPREVDELLQTVVAEQHAQAEPPAKDSESSDIAVARIVITDTGPASDEDAKNGVASAQFDRPDPGPDPPVNELDTVLESQVVAITRRCQAFLEEALSTAQAHRQATLREIAVARDAALRRMEAQERSSGDQLATAHASGRRELELACEQARIQLEAVRAEIERARVEVEHLRRVASEMQAAIVDSISRAQQELTNGDTAAA
jgi:hypothetical protein